jgi:uncharacterized membrane protein
MSQPFGTRASSRAAAGYSGVQNRPGSRFGVASLVFGIVALIFSWLLAGLFFGSFAVVFGFVQLERVARGETGTRRGMAVAGMVLGVVAIVISIAALGFRIWLIS